MNAPEMESVEIASPPTLPRSIFMGSGGFLVASIVVYGSWALAGQWMYETLSEIGAYTVWAILFVVISGAALRPLIEGPRALLRSYLVFTASFFLYAAAWTAAWFSMRDLAGEWLASFVGTVVMGIALAGMFRNFQPVIRICAALFIGHSIGYFVGRLLYDAVAGPPGMILWGVAYGIGFGAGIGYAYFAAQQRGSRSA